MDILFKQNSLRPGDPGFKYDVEEDFEPYEVTHFICYRKMSGMKVKKTLYEKKLTNL
jgi:hypothetical protein